MINTNIKINRLAKTLTIITTYKCSASCINCCFECSPQRTEIISYENVVRNIDNTIKQFPNIRTLVLTGGESLLNLDFVCRILSYAKKYNLVCRVVTNGFWGKTEKVALEVLVRLKDVGLNELNISTGDDHLEYVNIDRIRNCIKAALYLDIKTIINLESGNDRTFCIDDLNCCLNGLNEKDKLNYSVIKGMWMPFTEESLHKLKQIPKGFMHPVMERCVNIFSGITISPNNDLLSCCGLPVNYISFFNVGNLNIDDIETLYSRQFHDFLKIWLYVEGPYSILSYVESQMNIEIPELRVLSHMCFYCAVLFTNNNYLSAVRKCYKKKYDSVMIKFYLLMKKR